MTNEMKNKNILPQHQEQYPLWAWAKCGASIAPRKRKNTTGEIQDAVKIIFEKSDKAMYESKMRGKHAFTFYDERFINVLSLRLLYTPLPQARSVPDHLQSHPTAVPWLQSP